jgi:hypothetical protein
METLLVGVTLVSLALAAAMAAVAWKLLRTDRERSAARADALHALAFDAPAPDLAVERRTATNVDWLDADEAARDAPRRIETTTAAHEDRASSFAPVAPRPAATESTTFETNAGLDDWDFAMREPDESLPLDLDPTPRSQPAVIRVPSHAAHFATVEPVAGSGRAATLTIAGLAAAAIVVLGAALWSSGLVAAANNPRGTSLASLFTRTQPLELLSLRNTRSPDGGFVVTGLVENPARGSRVDDLDVVVYLFDRDGRYFASGQAAIDERRLDPGQESPFVVTVRNASAVSRYRVGFRQHDGGPVAHVDRRGQLPVDTPDTALADTHDAPLATGAIQPGTGLAP